MIVLFVHICSIRLYMGYNMAHTYAFGPE